jgi:enolase
LQLDSKCTIKSITAREILDSRGNPTVEAKVCTVAGVSAIASSPSGKSTGRNEALELRDSHNSGRFFGKGVLGAINNINERIASILVGRSCNEQHQIDRLMIEADGTENMHNFGANATTAVSIACAKAAAMEKKIPLFQQIAEIYPDFQKNKMKAPIPLMNIVNGGKHSGSGLSIQEFMIIPIGGRSLKESIRIGAEVYHRLRSLFSDRLGESATNVGDEGGFAPSTKSIKTESILSYICQAIDACGYDAESDVVIGIDCAANNFWNSSRSKYTIDGESLDSESLLDFYDSLCDSYPIRFIEDPFTEDNIEFYAKITSKLGKEIFIVGDDIFVTNKRRIELGIEAGAANSVIIKVNQVGTLTAALDAVSVASTKLWGIIASHRSGETNDDWLSDLSVGIGADAIKAGAPARGERVAKYNRLVAIEQINPDLSYSKRIGFKPDNIMKYLG